MKPLLLLILLSGLLACNNSPKTAGAGSTSEAAKELPKNEQSAGDAKADKDDHAATSVAPAENISKTKAAIAAGRDADQKEEEVQKSPVPSLTIYAKGSGHAAEVEKVLMMNCGDAVFETSHKFRVSQIKEHEQSSEKTGKYDGEKFCLFGLGQNARLDCKIFYTRNEGGHYSDQITLSLVKLATNEIYSLPLVSYFGKEGYEEIIESEFLEFYLIQRKVIQKYGSPKLGDVNGIRQARTETIQKFQITPHGELQLISTDSKDFNF